MDLTEIRDRLTELENPLATSKSAEFGEFPRDARTLRVVITARFYKLTRKAGMWKSKEMCSALKNASYGFDADRTRSPGGRDGIFLVDRDFRPANAMMHKLFDRYLDHPGSGAGEVAATLGVTLGDLVPVRLVSHHMRCLGVLARQTGGDVLALVDYDSG